MAVSVCERERERERERIEYMRCVALRDVVCDVCVKT